MKFITIVLRTCIGSFGVDMNTFWDAMAWAICWVDTEWPKCFCYFFRLAM